VRQPRLGLCGLAYRGPAEDLGGDGRVLGLLVDAELSSLRRRAPGAGARAGEQQSHFDARHYVGYYRSSSGNENLLYMAFAERSTPRRASCWRSSGQCRDHLREPAAARGKSRRRCVSTVYIIGEAVERRSKETRHVRRVGELAALLAQAAGIA